MIIHDPRVLYIAFGLHLCTKSHSTPNPVNEHLEMNDLLTKYFTHETTFFDEIVMTLRLQLKDIVNVTSTQMLLEWSNKVLYIWQGQDKKFVLNLFELTALENLATIVTTIIEQMFGKKGFIGA